MDLYKYLIHKSYTSNLRYKEYIFELIDNDKYLFINILSGIFM